MTNERFNSLMNEEFAKDPRNAFWFQSSFPCYFTDENGDRHVVDYDPLYKKWLEILFSNSPESQKILDEAKKKNSYNNFFADFFKK